MADKFTLYSYWRSSCSWRIRIALALKNLDYDYKAVNLLKSEQLEEEYKSEFNAMGQVPTLLIEKSDGRKIQLTQSLAIIEYLDQVYDNGPKLIPEDAEAAFRAREIANMIGSGIQPVQNFAVLKKVIALGADKLDWGRKTITEGFKAVENAIKPEWKFSAGDAITVADLCLVPQVYNAKRFGVEMSSFPRISEVAARLEAIEEFKAAHPSMQPDAAN